MDEELNELRREFLAEAEQKVREMQAALDGDPTPESLGRLAYLAHQLKGSGGSYGYQRISTDAAEVEKAAEALTEGKPADGLEARMQLHVVNLRTEIERSAKELGASPAS